MSCSMLSDLQMCDEHRRRNPALPVLLSHLRFGVSGSAAAAWQHVASPTISILPHPSLGIWQGLAIRPCPACLALPAGSALGRHPCIKAQVSVHATMGCAGGDCKSGVTETCDAGSSCMQKSNSASEVEEAKHTLSGKSIHCISPAWVAADPCSRPFCSAGAGPILLLSLQPNKTTKFSWTL